MPTLIEPTQVTPVNQSRQSPGRYFGSKNKHNFVNARKEMERVYNRMGGFDGLYQWANLNPENTSKFYEWFVKIFASFELKAEESSSEPIRVVILAPGQAMPAQAETVQANPATDQQLPSP